MKTRHHISADYGEATARITFDFDVTYTGAAQPTNPQFREPGRVVEFVTAEIDLGAGRFVRPETPIGGDLAERFLDEWAKDWLDQHEDEAAEIAMTARIEDEDRERERRDNGQFGVGA